nr:MAG TPA: hypothetical protein [Caudoviricetes sp.]
MDKTLTGGPSHAQNSIFKHPIDPLNIKTLENTDKPAFADF